MFARYITYILVYFVSLSLYAGGNIPWNDPYPLDAPDANTFYTSFTERPKHLDPARSYSSNEWIIINQVYEPPLQYHYLKRPYTLVPLVAAKMPEITYLDKTGNPIPENSPSSEVAYTVYTISIQPNVQFQPHPAFAQHTTGGYRYHHLLEDELEDIQGIEHFSQQGSRELTAEDFVYQVKRLANPLDTAPIYGMMAQYIEGLAEFSQTLKSMYQETDQSWIDLRKIPLKGVQIIDRYTYSITLKGLYPQFQFWLATPFFAPMAWEADKFFAQPGLIEKNITLDWYPIGTGPYMLVKNNPNQEIVLVKNPYFHGETYPETGAPDDEASGLLKNKGKPLPFIGKIQFTLEKESIPYWNKFLQGYYDSSGISTESFDSALQNSAGGGLSLTEPLREKGITLKTNVLPSTFYWGFNMDDPIVGGLGQKQKWLRQAISIALDLDEYVDIFLNGRGIVAQGPIPPGIFGYQEGQAGVNPYLFAWNKQRAKPQRKSIEDARELLAKAGYPNGRDPKTNHPLILNFDTVVSSGPDSQAMLAWMRKQFRKLGIQLVIRATQYNRFQEKMSTGQAQFFSWGWNADYPDPENFLFLLYGPNGKVAHGGENAANYNNAEFNDLFEKMKSMPDGPERLAIIEHMLTLVQADAPWIWGIHPKQFALNHQWIGPTKPNAIANNTIKYVQLNPELREKLRTQWNQPVIWPIFLLIGLALLLCLPAVIHYYRKEHQGAL